MMTKAATMRLRDLVCPFCHEDRAALRIDRKGRPFLTCSCGTRCFIPHPRDAVRYLATTEPLLASHRERCIDPTYLAKTRDCEREVANTFTATLAAERASPENVASDSKTITTRRTA